MRIVCAGGGPAGLYFAIQMKRRDPSHRIAVFERNGPDDTFGWGVVFSDETLRNLEGADPLSKQEILESFAHWDDIDIHFKGRVITSGGHGFCGIERRHLLNILQRRAMALGVELLFQRELDDAAAFPDADLIVAADGINSRVRGRYAAHFKPTIDVRKNRFIWLGTHRMFQAFTFIFVETAYGWFQAHAYRFNHDTSTFIVETTEQNWRAAGLDQLDTAGTIGFCERLFEPWLQGHRLLANMNHLRGSQWLNFPRVANESWVMGNVVLMGDAAHSAHFSIGSGTKLALEDAIALARAFDTHGTNVPAALAAYEAERKTEVLRVQSAARNSTEWFENVARYVHLEPEQFAYSLLTRSQRISHENLRLRDRPWLEGMERWLADRAGHPAHRPIPPMFLPFQLRDDAARQPDRRLADGDLQRARRPAERLPPGPPWRPRTRRGGTRVHRDGLRHAARPHHPRLRGTLVRRADARLVAHRRFRARELAGEALPATWSFRAERFDPGRLGGHGCASSS